MLLLGQKENLLLYTRISGEGWRVLYHSLVEVTWLLLGLLWGLSCMQDPIAGYLSGWVSVCLVKFTVQFVFLETDHLDIVL